MDFSGEIIAGDESLGYFGVRVPSAILQHYRDLKIKRFVFTANESVSFHGAFVPIGGAEYLVIINQERRKKLSLRIGDNVTISIKEDKSKYGMPLPDEMAMAFEADEEGAKYFHALTPGKIRNLLYMVDKVKNPDKRIEKAIVILEHLRANKGKLDYKMLNTAFKEYGKLY